MYNCVHRDATERNALAKSDSIKLCVERVYAEPFVDVIGRLRGLYLSASWMQ